MIDKWHESVDEGGAINTLTSDLLKDFDCFTHELLIAKCHAHVLI